MGGLAVLFLLGLYFVLTVLAIVKVKPLWAKGLVLLTALLIPTADAVYGRYKLKQMCAAEAGLKVYKVAHNVEGFMVDGADEPMLEKYGFEFIEGESSPRKYYRFSKKNGQIVIEENITPKSVYRVRSYHESELGLYLKYKQDVTAIQSGEKFAEHSEIGFKGGWAERFLAAFSDAGGGVVKWCTPLPWLGNPKDEVIVNSLKK